MTTAEWVVAIVKGVLAIVLLWLSIQNIRLIRQLDRNKPYDRRVQRRRWWERR